MPALSGGQITTLRTHPHRTKLYLAVLKPATIYAMQVNDATIAKGERDIIYDNGSGTPASVLAGMSLWVGTVAGSQNKGRVRIKSISDNGDGTGTITVAENEHIDWEDDDYITCKEIFEFWPVYPRVTNSGGLTWYKDYDVTYSDQNLNLSPVPIMGPPACAFREAGTAQVYFDGQDSYCLGSSIQWGSGNSEWTFPSGTPSTSTSATPGYVSWTSIGTYMVKLEAKAANGKTLIGYRPVFIFDRTGANAPYTDFEIRNLRGNLSQGGWSFDVSVFGDADEGEFATGTMVVVFSESWYGGTAKAFGLNHPGRQNIRCVGWITTDQVRKDVESGEVRFHCEGIAGLMKSREDFSVALNYVSGTPADWIELQNMDWDRAMHHYLQWHSTIFTMTDVRLSGQIHSGFPGPFLIKAQDFARGSVWSCIAKLAMDCFLVPAADRTSCLYVDYDPHFLSTSDRLNVPTVMTFAHGDWETRLEIQQVMEKRVNFVDFEGLAFDGTDITPIISYAPGRAPEYMGSPRPSKRHVLDPSGDWQSKANDMAGFQLAKNNNEFPNIRFSGNGDYSITDIAPREWTKLTLVAADTKRGLVWDAQRLLTNTIEERYDHRNGDCHVRFTFEKETSGPPGVTGDYPPDEPPPPPPEPPPIPVPPEPEGQWRKKVYWAGAVKGVYYTENFVTNVESPLGVPTWTEVNDGISPSTSNEVLAFKPDPFNPAGRQYILLEVGAYTRTGGSWSSILTEAAARALIPCNPTAAGWFPIGGMDCNINVDGWVGVIYNAEGCGAGWASCFLYSTDYGASWNFGSYIDGPTALGAWAMSLTVGAYKGDSPYAAGDVLYCVGRGGAVMRLYHSNDRGTTGPWPQSSTTLHSSTESQFCLVDPNNQHRAFPCALAVGSPTPAGVTNDGGASHYQFDSNAPHNLGSHHGALWVSVAMDGYPTIRYGAHHTTGHKIARTRDNGVSWNTFSTEETPTNRSIGISIVQDAPDCLYLVRLGGSGTTGDPHMIWASANEGITMYDKGGANANLADGGGDSIPYNAGDTRGLLQVWTG